MIPTRLALVFACVAAGPVHGDEPPPPTVEALKGELSVLRNELARTEAELALALGKLALGNGRREAAAAYGRKALEYYEKFWALIIKGGGCMAEAEVRFAQRQLLDAHILVAEAEGRRDVLLAELPKLIDCHEGLVRMYKDLRQRNLVSEKAAADGVAESEAEIRRARARLAETRASGKAVADRLYLVTASSITRTLMHFGAGSVVHRTAILPRPTK